ncbi:lysozyme inhibitor LprI family protein [Colwellia sp. 1_MG-2023]|uniref:lysozyme inhibitor LprI family protein n=1 Tax=Colwellia sp. 1_MG-2023 TaxID=3062649 RepID=UPI0026E2CB24|nr:lysozyme inhibitor LprI family protein [Colwellia sp. 1_MG-2023]MDO6447273.1 lysozyme inhibitor LprI family protein [Colwellia sp. 1_MG-2023]
MLNAKISCLITLLFSLNVYSVDTSVCYDTAMSQLDLNRCAGVNNKKAELEMQRVILEIQRLYKGEVKFLSNLEQSQQNWETQLELDLNLKFPKADEALYYGSVFPMCYSSYKTRLMLQRIAFLKEWLEGSKEGEVCSGSIKHEYFLKHVER